MVSSVSRQNNDKTLVCYRFLSFTLFHSHDTCYTLQYTYHIYYIPITIKRNKKYTHSRLRTFSHWRQSAKIIWFLRRSFIGHLSMLSFPVVWPVHCNKPRWTDNVEKTNSLFFISMIYTTHVTLNRCVECS